MLINEFNSKFTSKNEKSRLFKALRRLSRLETQILLSSGAEGWVVWPPDEDGSGARLLNA
jgi:hypothetical protein